MRYCILFLCLISIYIFYLNSISITTHEVSRIQKQNKTRYRMKKKLIRKTHQQTKQNIESIKKVYKKPKRVISSIKKKQNMELMKKIHKRPKQDIESIYKFITNPDLGACKIYHTLKGENEKEPDIRICMDNIKPPCNVISIGIAYNFIFDKFMLSKGCRVWSYDPSMNEGNYDLETNHKFFHIGIGKQDGVSNDKSTLYQTDKSKRMKTFKIKTLKTMMSDMDIKFIDVLRIDVEGAEWDIIDSFEYKNIGQLLIEVHMWKKYKDKIHKILSIPHTLFWTARNKWDNTKLYKSMTSVYELGFKIKSMRKNIEMEHIPANAGKYMAIAQHKNTYYFIQNKHFNNWKIHNFISVSDTFTSFKNFKKIKGVWDDQRTCLIHNVAFLPTEKTLYLFGGTGNSDLLNKKYRFCLGHSMGSIQDLNSVKTVIMGKPIDTDALPSIVLYKNKYYVYTRLNIDKHMSGKRGVRVFIMNSLNDAQKTHIQVKLPFYSYTQNIVYYDGKFHGFFASYNNINHSPYNIIKIAYGVSDDGLDFTIIKRDLFPNENIFLVNGYVKYNNNVLVYFYDLNTKTVFYMTLM